MKAGISLSLLLISLIAGICFAGDLRLRDFLQRHAHQLEQHQSDNLRQAKIAHMLARQLRHIATGGDINTRDRRGQTALMMAAALNHTEIATGLLIHGADPTLSTPKGRCAHHLSTQPELTRRLLSCCTQAHPGATLHAAVQAPGANLDRVLKTLRSTPDINQPGPDGKTALMLVPAQNTELAHMLLAAGATPSHWAAGERARARVNRIEILFTHHGLTSEELQAEDAANALILDRQRAENVKWQRFTDPALVRLRPRTRPSSFQWDKRKKQHICNNLIYQQNSAHSKPEDGRSGYVGPVYRGTVTLHYDTEGVPPMSFPVQSGGRAHHYFGSEERTAPSIPEGMTARIYPDFHGYSINGFYISCLGRKAIPKFTEDRNSILLHLALIAVPGENEETTIRSSGSHGCISLKNLNDWKIIYHELREKGRTPADGIEVTINYAVK